jgi:hypothetical protein
MKRAGTSTRRSRQSDRPRIPERWRQAREIEIGFRPELACSRYAEAATQSWQKDGCQEARRLRGAKADLK